jgi:molecular chaperone HscB
MEQQYNYFTLFGIKEQLNPDPAALKRSFYALSKQWHPDRFVSATDEERNEALRMSALINDAYKTLTDPEQVLAYLLRSKNLLEPEEVYKLPADFLMEMMDLNEAISDYEDNPELKTQAEQAFQEQWDAVQLQQDALAQRLEGGDGDAGIWQLLKDLYFRKKYLLRIRERLITFASR